MGDIMPFPAPTQHAGAAGGRALLFHVIGDSMVPSYGLGDVAIVDVTEQAFTVDAVYVVSDGQQAVLCRLQALYGPGPARVRLIRDNPLYVPEEADLADVEIFGRVVGVIAAR